MSAHSGGRPSCVEVPAVAAPPALVGRGGRISAAQTGCAQARARSMVAGSHSAQRKIGWLTGAALVGFALGVAADPWRSAAWSVALFAGLHNWTELRYALQRAPARAGRLRGFIALAVGGVLLLGGGHVALSLGSAHDALSAAAQGVLLSLWETCLVLWGLALVACRARLPPRRDWYYAYPAGCVLIAGAWLAPGAWSVGLMFVHPLLALAMLDRELRRRRSPWQGAFQRALWMLPWALGLAVALAAWRYDLPGSFDAAQPGVRPTFSSLWPSDWTAAMLAAYALLELLHYGAWIAAIPAASRSGWSLRGNSFPLALRSAFCRRALAVWLALAALALGGLWLGFAWDYAWMWTWYFRVAIFHVLLELPLLLRSL